ncbi:MAG: crossover junction endodeoxyribonuclease RuvC [Methylocapsa sp.]|nr:crossover junction endodeoxyribonuclease RuvC [Methylocapsa sp.]
MQRGIIRVLGIDPGLRATGWGIVEACGAELAYIASGCIRPVSEQPIARRLCQIHEGLSLIIREFRPGEAAIEETFVNRDPQSALKLGQARGICLAVPALCGLRVAEYAANLVKKTLTGTGHAAKEQIAMMVGILLPGSEAQSSDAADALAVAITHCRLGRAASKTG